MQLFRALVLLSVEVRGPRDGASGEDVASSPSHPPSPNPQPNRCHQTTEHHPLHSSHHRLLGAYTSIVFLAGVDVFN